MISAVASGGGSAIAVPRPGVQPHRDVRQAVGLVGPLPQPRLRAGVGEDVAAFGRADVGGHRDDGHAGDQATGDRQHRGRGRRGQHRHPLRAADPLGHRRRGADQVAAAQHGAVDAHRVADIGAGGDGRGVQRGQQHAKEVTRRRSPRYWASGSHPAHRVPRGVPQRLDGACGRTRSADPTASDGIYGVVDKPDVCAGDRPRRRPVPARRAVPLSARAAALGVSAGHGAGPRGRARRRPNSPPANCVRRPACAPGRWRCSANSTSRRG